ncbi:hypothetical protein [Streptomyces sp. NPDC048496]
MATADHDPAPARALAGPADQDRLFTASVRALVNRLPASGGT